jgi:hypothetical protein
MILATLNILLLSGGEEDFLPLTSLWILLAVGLWYYFIPSLTGRRKPNSMTIFAVNLLLGWTIIGWGYALFLALKKPTQHFSPQGLRGSQNNLLA